MDRLTFPGARYDSNPTYAPAGDMITFERDSADLSTTSVMVMNPDATGIRRIQADAYLPTWGPALAR